MTALHHQLGLIGALFCLLVICTAITFAIREIRFNRRIKRERLNKIFDGVVPHRK